MTDDDLGKLFRQQLPDEDPPETGMAALMAAARTKAAQMAATPPKPSLWARMVELFKRPPVLAFATIVVLIGGAVIVKRHGSELEVAGPAPLAAPARVVTASVEERRQDVPPPPMLVPPSTNAGSAAVAPMDRAGPAPPPPTMPAKAAPTARPASRAPAEAESMQVDDGVAIGREVATPTPTVTEAPRPVPERDAKRPTAPPVGLAIATDDVAVAAPAPTPSAEQLLHECQSAAMRGDCTAVRTIAGRIAKSNAEFYRSRVVKDAAIAKCLP